MELIKRVQSLRCHLDERKTKSAMGERGSMFYGGCRVCSAPVFLRYSLVLVVAAKCTIHTSPPTRTATAAQCSSRSGSRRRVLLGAVRAARGRAAAGGGCNATPQARSNFAGHCLLTSPIHPRATYCLARLSWLLPPPLP